MQKKKMEITYLPDLLGCRSSNTIVLINYESIVQIRLVESCRMGYLLIRPVAAVTY